MAPLTPAPAPAHALRLELATALDHEVTRVGIVCSAWTVDNPISQLLTRMVPGSATAAMDRPAELTLRVEHAATLSRCFQVAELKARCLTRVTLDGNAVIGGAARPVHAAGVRRYFLDHLAADDRAALQRITDKLHAALQDGEN